MGKKKSLGIKSLDRMITTAENRMKRLDSGIKAAEKLKSTAGNTRKGLTANLKSLYLGAQYSQQQGYLLKLKGLKNSVNKNNWGKSVVSDKIYSIKDSIAHQERNLKRSIAGLMNITNTDLKNIGLKNITAQFINLSKEERESVVTNIKSFAQRYTSNKAFLIAESKNWNFYNNVRTGLAVKGKLDKLEKRLNEMNLDLRSFIDIMGAEGSLDDTAYDSIVNSDPEFIIEYYLNFPGMTKSYNVMREMNDIIDYEEEILNYAF